MKLVKSFKDHIDHASNTEAATLHLTDLGHLRRTAGIKGTSYQCLGNRLDSGGHPLCDYGLLANKDSARRYRCCILRHAVSSGKHKLIEVALRERLYLSRSLALSIRP